MLKRKALSVVGARPQFIKLAPIASAFEGKLDHVVVHTGQHYDEAMSGVFFEDLIIPHPDYNLEVGSGSHAAQTASMMTRLEGILKKEEPDVVVVYGDTNSTLAGALVAAKLNIPVAHIEAGLRSFNRDMPEEINRIVTDRLSRLLFCPTETAMRNLFREGMKDASHLVGDVMFDALLLHRSLIDRHSSILASIGVRRAGFYLATVHRASNTDDVEALTGILNALNALDAPVVFPLHPRTRDTMAVREMVLGEWSRILFVEPVGYLDMLALQANARKVLTDSGGVQKESYCLGTPCVTLRLETEWVETLESGWNTLAGMGKESIIEAALMARPSAPQKPLYGSGRASHAIADILLEAVI